MPPSIIVGYDGGPRGQEALRLAQRLAALEDSQLVVATAYPEATRTGVLATAFDQSSLEEASAVLDTARSNRFIPNHTEFRAVPGATVAAALRELAREREADLIVIGSPRVQIRAAIGPQSTAEQVLHDSPCSVLVARPGEPGRLERIGVAVDGSATSRAAVAAGRFIAERGPGQVRYVDLILIEPDANTYHLEPHDPGLFIKEASAAREWAECTARLPMGDAEVRLIRQSGDPAGELIQLSSGLDLLITGSRSRGPLRTLVLGSVSTELVRQAACPVMVVPRTAVASGRKFPFAPVVRRV